MPEEPFVRIRDLCRHYQRGGQTVRALDGVSLEIYRGEFLAIVGSSGSGKTTLLSLLAGLDTPTSGTIEVDGVDLGSLTRRQLSRYRAEKAGMVFQSFNLLGHHSAVQNVETALYFTDTPHPQRRRRAIEGLAEVGLVDRDEHRPAHLSGGEQQRVAVARAIVKRPEILLADEPTGNLDLDNATQIVELLSGLNRNGLTVVMVTHNTDLARRYAHRSVRLHYGRVVADPEGGAHQ
jgi:putative ABC transport system ATP-binding protein